MQHHTASTITDDCRTSACSSYKAAAFSTHLSPPICSEIIYSQPSSDRYILRWPFVPNFPGQSWFLRGCSGKIRELPETLKFPVFGLLSWFCSTLMSMKCTSHDRFRQHWRRKFSKMTTTHDLHIQSTLSRTRIFPGTSPQKPGLFREIRDEWSPYRYWCFLV